MDFDNDVPRSGAHILQQFTTNSPHPLEHCRLFVGMHMPNTENSAVVGATGQSKSRSAYLAGLDFFFAGSFASCGTGGIASMRRYISASLNGATAFSIMGGSLWKK
jgi:hypothetical protein